MLKIYRVGRPKNEKVMITTDSQDVFVRDTIANNTHMLIQFRENTKPL